MCGLNFEHMLSRGGLGVYEAEAGEKSTMFYEYVDSTDGFFVNDIDPEFRSRVNIPFKITA